MKETNKNKNNTDVKKETKEKKRHWKIFGLHFKFYIFLKNLS